MIFNEINDQSVELRITNYEFPEITDCKYDANWLLIQLKIKSNCGNWETTDPSLFTWEVERIIDWFNDLYADQTTETNLSFLEPNIAFQLIKNQGNLKTIRLKFDLELQQKDVENEKECFVDCEMNNAELKRAANGLKKELEAYPQRTV
ncbi:hypothetical protein OOZ15_08950 [Galbibacter sp. EGI 63066]|uniref:WapI family immunity protein n=1 Tax=Galbibacter sp. EGI 63066 TaxID=2993559 RepID=UPI002248F124|nr:hypothetical protein [Galbibacter sp. EGI 63066]MCX2680063.1 hypothetical protein [Galbibacter sp. EGI 63066]